MASEPFDAVLAEMRVAKFLVPASTLREYHDRLAAAHAAEVAVKKSLAKEVWAAIARADAAVGLLRECAPIVGQGAANAGSNEPTRKEWLGGLSRRITALLAQQAQVGGENGNG